MKAICVKADGGLEVRDIPEPDALPPGHVLVQMDSSAINHGDKSFLAMPQAAGNPLANRRHNTWGASGAGRIVAIGDHVPVDYHAGKQVAIYWSLCRSPEGIGLWSEKALVPFETCLILPDHVQMRDYSGSLVNVMTAYAFLDEIAADGHKGIIVTAGSSATGYAAASLVRRRGVPAIFVTRSTSSRDMLIQQDVEHVLASEEEGFEQKLGTLAAQLETTAVFDGVGGALITRIAPHLVMNSTIYVYGFLGAKVPVSTLLVMGKNLTIRRFSNFESATVKNRSRLSAALRDLEGQIENPMFRTRIGREFSFEQIDEAMAYEAVPGAKAVLAIR
ncbi:NADPH2:quinone reductase [Bradyrhizobium sp. S3.12.5]|uniref:quinone oxidoreductase family protein n=1 Tax=Bradyrhizobium sp. S3.12.5 TaxID=3156386 RepID=UPI00339401D6